MPCGLAATLSAAALALAAQVSAEVLPVAEQLALLSRRGADGAGGVSGSASASLAEVLNGTNGEPGDRHDGNQGNPQPGPPVEIEADSPAPEGYDVVVVGGGVMGLSVAEGLARRGRRVLLLDAKHAIRGSWGVSRASHLRMEDPTLLQMSLFSIRKWLDLQGQYAAAVGAGVGDGEALLYKKTGAAMVGPAEAIHKVADAVRQELKDVPEGEHEVLSASEATARFPQLRLNTSERLFYSPHGYTMLIPKVMACLEWAARKAGARLVQGTVASIDRERKEVFTEDGASFKYSQLVITAGSWTNRALSSAGLKGLPIFVSNEQTIELVPRDGAPSHSWNELPLFTWSEAGYKGRGKDGGCMFFYTTPHVPTQGSGSTGVKIGFHRQGPLLDNDEFVVAEGTRAMAGQLPHIRKEFRATQEFGLDEFAWQHARDFARRKMPHLDADVPARHTRCLYQMTPDMKMIVGGHPDDPDVVIASGFSGSGFQFAPAIAEALVALVAGDEPTPMLSAMLDEFSPLRFASTLQA